MKSVSCHIQDYTDMYRWLSREFTTVEYTRTCEQIDIYIIQNIYVEAVTTNCEIVANHLAYTHMYMFLVAGNAYEVFCKNTDNCKGT